MMGDNVYKKVTYKNSCTDVKWKIGKISSLSIWVDIDNLCFMGALQYIKQNISPLKYIANYVRGSYLNYISDYVKNTIQMLQSEYKVMIVSTLPDLTYSVNDVSDFSMFNLPNDVDSVDLSELNVFSDDSYISFIKHINNDIIHRRYNIKLPLTTIIKDLNGIVYSTNLDMLVFNDVTIVKFDNGKWYHKCRNDIRNAIIANPYDSLVLTCVLLGTSYKHALKTTTKKSILKDTNKIGSVCNMLKDNPDLLATIMYKYENAF
jgi:hypothetical protein